MDLSLNKLPWYAQVGLFVALAVAGVAAFYYLYAVPAEQALEVAAASASRRSGSTSARAWPSPSSCRSSGRRWPTCEARLDGLKAILPDEKDFGDLLRNLQTLAVQSNLTIRVFKPAPVVTKQLHAEWPINIELDGTYHNLGLFFDRISRFSRIINIGNMAHEGQGQARPEHEHLGGVRGDDLRPARRREGRAGDRRRSRPPAAPRGPRREASHEAPLLLALVLAASAAAGPAGRRRQAAAAAPAVAAPRRRRPSPTTPRGAATRS